MDKVTVLGLSQRLERAEWMNRSLTATGMLLLVLVAFLGISGQTSSQNFARVVKAEEFVLVDQSGAPAARLGVSASGARGLAIYDGAGKQRFSVEVGNGEDADTRIVITDKHERVRVAVGVEANGEPGVELWDATRARARFALQGNEPILFLDDRAGTSRVRLGVVSTGPVVALLDETGKTRVGLSAMQGGPGSVELYDANRRLTALLSAEPGGSAKLSLAGSSNTERATLTVTEQGAAHLALYAENTTLRAAIAVSPDGESGAFLLSKEGKVIWEVP